MENQKKIKIEEIYYYLKKKNSLSVPMFLN